MSKVPVFGFIYRNAIVTVDRSNAADRMKSVRILKSIISKGISVLVFPEGTFNMSHQPLKEFYDGAFRIAIETQTPIKPVLFLDSYDRLKYHHVFTLTPGRCRILYLEEIPVAGLKENVYKIMSEKLREYKVSWLKP
jgi:1-acyl-sn-glycerol-3-phosphate acyltransferase